MCRIANRNLLRPLIAVVETNCKTWLKRVCSDPARRRAPLALIQPLEFPMIPFRLSTVATVAVLMAFAVPQAHAQGACVNKAGEGTNSTVDGAKFQAWEAVLQATDWGIWSAMMSSKQEVGNAPGMTVSKLRSSCKPGGLGQTCVVQATLCRK